MKRLTTADLDALAYDDAGLVPVIAQDRTTGAVLMLAYADADALRRSLETGRMTYWSRSRRATWVKGETSGHTQRVVELRGDCDDDAVLALVEQQGPACHEGTATCFADDEAVPLAGLLGELDRVIRERQDADPGASHTAALLGDPAAAAAKLEEEAAEVLRVLRGQPEDDTLEHEAADLLYHLLVALRTADVGLEDVLGELRGRRS